MSNMASPLSSPVPESADEHDVREDNSPARAAERAEASSAAAKATPRHRSRVTRGGLSNEEDEMNQFQLFQAFLRSRRRRGQESDDDGPAAKGATGPPPDWYGPTSDVTFEDWMIKANLWIATTKHRPRLRGPMLLKALHGVPFECFKHLAKDSNWVQSDRNAEELLQKMDTPEYFGDDREEHLLSSLARITFHLKARQTRRLERLLCKMGSGTQKSSRTQHLIAGALPRLPFDSWAQARGQ